MQIDVFLLRVVVALGSLETTGLEKKMCFVFRGYHHVKGHGEVSIFDDIIMVKPPGKRGEMTQIHIARSLDADRLNAGRSAVGIDKHSRTIRRIDARQMRPQAGGGSMQIVPGFLPVGIVGLAHHDPLLKIIPHNHAHGVPFCWRLCGISVGHD